MKSIRKVIDKFIEWICIFFIGTMTILVTWQVITRYFFKKPSAISEQLSKYMFVWLVLLASAYVFGKREHMAIVFLKEKFSGIQRCIIEVICEIVIFIFAGSILFYGGFKNTLLTLTQRDSALPITIGCIYIMIPICGFIIMFYSICNICDVIKTFSKCDKKSINKKNNFGG
ncbi:hypothetical protein ADU90_04010 [Clostridium botulinum]|uniref:Tripartite ATP-independent periplasmic transporters DctQ component domain-containing protein n=1 Tax=Clostridium botulinum C/D str. DC5 TaxID=1443128 RepID=A0A0A0ICA3_CLOBO|nr:TRAP transporter small permease [Clostridium botulinum]KEI03164.1 hypothetical protein Z952_08345 [Clostridium botulinum C/D str. BKT75002]KEI07539.1 hypothetical protein Z954_03545 [Clostridium botulinum C/D str. BKT2873]KGM93753.1 hypothetical protein Z956_10545 [Clostridium botulinum D str. CCUG 7971]KGM98552.1 hypothetical protein Z955_11200 [Clostridium botulinum C/D str. DC5]KOC49761.1 hypothetical protein ADU88_04725 [Clostridium botulinum]